MEVTTALGPVSVVSVKGDIDSASFREFVQRADQVLEKGHVNLVIDLQGVNYISSAGLIGLQTVMGHAATRGGKAVFAGLTPRVSRVLQTTGFDRQMSLFPDVESAKAGFAP